MDDATSAIDDRARRRAGVHASVADIQGWLTPAQIDVLADVAAAVPADGRIVEIGSFQGRSTVVLALAAPVGVEIVAIDPHAGNDRGPQEIDGYEHEAEDDHRRFHDNLAAAGVGDRVRHVRDFSDRALGEVDGLADVVFVDGAHRFRPARADLRDWGARVRPDGILLVHDAFSSVGVTAAILTELVPGRGWRYEGRAGSLAQYRRSDVAGIVRVSSVGRQLASLGWFARNVVVKALLVAHLRPVARALGHDGETWPY